MPLMPNSMYIVTGLILGLLSKWSRNCWNDRVYQSVSMAIGNILMLDSFPWLFVYKCYNILALCYISIITVVLRSTNTFYYVATFFYFAITENLYQKCSYMFPVYFLLLKVYTSPCIMTIPWTFFVWIDTPLIQLLEQIK